VKLGPAEYNTKQAQGCSWCCPKKQVSTDLGAPYAGSKFYYSGTGDNLDTSMTKSIALPAGAVSFSAQGAVQHRADWDYAYLTVNGTPVVTDRSTGIESKRPELRQRHHRGSRRTWGSLNGRPSAYAGQTVTIGLRYWTDGAAQGTPARRYAAAGFQIDDIAITGQATDGAETAAGWTFSPGNGSDSASRRLGGSPLQQLLPGGEPPVHRL
jgi:immune inhibitor A